MIRLLLIIAAYALGAVAIVGIAGFVLAFISFGILIGVL
jgi:hypothetical protein